LAHKPLHPFVEAIGTVMVLLVLAVCLAPDAFSQPAAAQPYRRDLVNAVRLSWGLDGPVATMAGQVHQESAWKPDARSPYAHGLAQFTPATADWIEDLDPMLAGADTGNPVWALRALARYDRWLFDRVPDQSSGNCYRWFQTLRAYNGGLGWLNKEHASGRHCVEYRSVANCEENLTYPRRILHKHEPLYLTWGRGMECWK
jgi:hypothetical protein